MTEADRTAQIRDASATDLSALHALNIAGEPGVGAISEGDLEALIAVSAATLVAAEEGGAPLGFLLLLGPGAEYRSPNYRWFCDRHRGPDGSRPFVYVDRIAVAAAARGRRIGEALYAAAFARFAGAGLIGCEVNTAPPNPGSLRFHQRLGFVEVGTRVFVPGAKAVVYLERPL
ncbi:MAG: GNAT family N-acetyltransferase [Pseudomonadota bacterium]